MGENRYHNGSQNDYQEVACQPDADMHKCLFALTCSDTDGFNIDRACSKCESSIKEDEPKDDVPFSRNANLSSTAVMAASCT